MGKQNNVQQPIIYAVLGLFLGVGIAWAGAAVAVDGNHSGMMKAMGLHANTGAASTHMTADTSMTMGQMVRGLQGKTGAAFDQTFLNEMIPHHQGAVDMAKLALTNAKHDELKKMANDIVTNQSKEITMMQGWQQAWGYAAAPGQPSGTMMMQ